MLDFAGDGNRQLRRCDIGILDSPKRYRNTGNKLLPNPTFGRAVRQPDRIQLPKPAIQPIDQFEGL